MTKFNIDSIYEQYLPIQFDLFYNALNIDVDKILNNDFVSNITLDKIVLSNPEDFFKRIVKNNLTKFDIPTCRFVFKTFLDFPWDENTLKPFQNREVYLHPNENNQQEPEIQQQSTHLSTPEHYEHVNHPSHYNNYSKEVIDMMVDIYGKKNTALFCEMNAFKYRMRMGTKPDNPIQQDINKEKWYLNKKHELEND